MRLIALLAAFLLTAFPAFAADKMTPREAAAAVESGKAFLIDIRTPGEWAETGIPTPATPIDMTAQDFVPQLKAALAANPGKTPAFICRTGNRSGQLVAALERAGLTQIIDVTGGVAGKGSVKGWIAEGLPVKKP